MPRDYLHSHPEFPELIRIVSRRRHSSSRSLPELPRLDATGASGESGTGPDVSGISQWAGAQSLRLHGRLDVVEEAQAARAHDQTAG